MLEKDYKYLITIITTLVAAIISSCIDKPTVKILFICIFVFICYLVINNLRNKMRWKQILIGICCVIEILIIIYSIAAIGSISSFFII